MYMHALRATRKDRDKGKARMYTRLDHDKWRIYEVEKQRLSRLAISADEYECMIGALVRRLGM